MDATINGEFNNVRIYRTNFMGAKGNINIDPEEIEEQDMSYTILSGVNFIGNFIV